MKAIISASVAVFVLSTAAVATEPRSSTEPLGDFSQGAGAGHQYPMDAPHQRDAPGTVEEKREWLRLRLVAALDDPYQIRDTEARLARMSPEQLDELVRVYRERAAEGELVQQRRRLAEATAARDELRRQYWERTGAVGFQPVVTWLPSGAHLSAGAAVSPDGRHVNVDAFPFFSEVHDVRTFRFGPHFPHGHPSVHGVPHGFFRGHPHGHHPRGHGRHHGHRDRGHRWQGPDQHSRDQAFPPTWYDGLRTRVGPRPSGR